MSFRNKPLLILLLSLGAIAFCLTRLSATELAEPSPASVVADIKERAANGEPYAQVLLAVLYRQGLHVKQDDNLAYEWAVKSAEKGHRAGQNFLGFLYMNGFGVSVDLVTARKWLELAKNAGDLDAYVNLAILSLKGAAPDKQHAIELLETAHLWGKIEATEMLAQMYYRGEFVAKDKEQALGYFYEAADGGSIKSQVFLGKLHLEGKDISKNEKASAHYYKKCAKQNNATCQFMTALNYHWGRGRPQDC